MKNLPYALEAEALRSHLASAAEVTSVEVLRDASGRSRGLARVVMADPAAAQVCVSKLNGVECGGRSLSVQLDERAQ